jgi:AraC-like DNA-binding protein
MPVVSIQTRDPAEARRLVGEVYFPHRLALHHDAATFGMTLSATRVGPVAIGHLSYSGEVSITTGDLETGYEVNVPLDGPLRTVTAHAEVCADPYTAAVYRPDSPATLHGWAGGGGLFGLKINRAALEGQLAELIDEPVRTVVRLDGSLDIGSGPGERWWSAARLLLELTRDPGGPLSRPLVARPLVRTVVAGLLYVAGHQYRDQLDTEPQPPQPGTIRRAAELLDERPEEPWTVGDLAAAVGVSSRSLQEGFRRHVGMPPMVYLRAVRLRHVHGDLQEADPVRHTVSELAGRWGFVHLGRFAALYRDRYGQPPSATLRQEG